METTYIGYIGAIELKKSPTGFEKKIVTLKMRDKQLCFIEFRNDPVKQQMKGIAEGDRVEISARLEGKISRSSGIAYNNIIAKSIKQITNN